MQILSNNQVSTMCTFCKRQKQSCRTDGQRISWQIVNGQWVGFPDGVPPKYKRRSAHPEMTTFNCRSRRRTRARNSEAEMTMDSGQETDDEEDDDELEEDEVEIPFGIGMTS